MTAIQPTCRHRRLQPRCSRRQRGGEHPQGDRRRGQSRRERPEIGVERGDDDTFVDAGQVVEQGDEHRRDRRTERHRHRRRPSSADGRDEQAEDQHDDDEGADARR